MYIPKAAFFIIKVQNERRALQDDNTRKNQKHIDIGRHEEEPEGGEKTGVKESVNI